MGNIWQAVNNRQYRENDWKYRYMQAVWHGDMQLITDLDRVFDQGVDKNINLVQQEVKRYEKDIKERGSAVVNQERTTAEKEKIRKKSQ